MGKQISIRRLRDDDPRLCWVGTGRGGICARPAVAVDVEKGYPVCKLHLPKKKEER